MNPHSGTIYEAPLDGEWQKASFSNGSSDHCVELRPIANGGVAIRDSKNPTRPELRYTPEEFTAFIKGIKAGEFDHLT